MDNTIELWLEKVRTNNKRNIFVERVERVINTWQRAAYFTSDSNYRRYAYYNASILQKELDNAVEFARNLPFGTERKQTI